MPNIKRVLFPCLLIFLLHFLLFPSPLLASEESLNCQDVSIWVEDKDGNVIAAPTPFTADTFDEINYVITVKDDDPEQEYIVSADGNTFIDYESGGLKIDSTTTRRISGIIHHADYPFQFRGKDHRLNVRRILPSGAWEAYCTKDYPEKDNPEGLKYTIVSPPTPTPVYSCSLAIQSDNQESPSKITDSDNINVFVNFAPPPDRSGFDKIEVELINQNTGKIDTYLAYPVVDKDNNETGEYAAFLGKHQADRYSVAGKLIRVVPRTGEKIIRASCTMDITICDSGCGVPTPTPTVTPTPTDKPECLIVCAPNGCEAEAFCKTDCSFCRPTPEPTSPFPRPDLKDLCNQLDPDFRDDCWKCIKDRESIWTAIGCLPTDFSRLINEYIFTFGAGIAGGISFLSFLYGTILILVSAGNPEKIEQGKQIIISALSGLLLIIFSIFILQIVGVEILKLPGFE